MSTLPDQNPLVTDDINNPPEHPLKDFIFFIILLVTFLVISYAILHAFANKLSRYIPLNYEPTIVYEVNTLSKEHIHKKEYIAGLIHKLDDNNSDINLIYIVDPTVNAAATLGNTLVIFSGLFDAVESENGLAMVIAHEMAHLEMRHPLTIAIRQLSFGLLTSSLLGHNESLITPMTELSFYSFSRTMEKQADERALKILEGHYGHTLGAEEFFLWAKDNSRSLNEFLSTHPATDTRLEQIKQSQPKPEKKYTLTELPNW